MAEQDDNQVNNPGEDNSSEHLDDQYQYTPESDAASQASYEPPTEDMPPVLNPQQKLATFMAEHKRITVAIVFVVAVTIVYQFIGGSSASKQQRAQLSAVSKSSGLSAQQAGMLSQLQRSRDELSQTMSSVQAISADTKSRADDLTQKMQVMRLQIMQLTADQKRMLSALISMTKEMGKLQHSKNKGKVAPPLTYYIQALVPGRAWLSSNQGDYLTIQVGSELKGGYGTVRRIDSDAGLIMTSSGKMVHYSASN